MTTTSLQKFSVRAACVLTSTTLVVCLAACGGDDSSEAEGTPPSTTTTTGATETYSTKHFTTPLDLAVPEWLDAQPQEDTAQFVTWESPDGDRALRILHPVEVYPPGEDGPVAPPDDFESYVLRLADSGGQLSDEAQQEIDGHPATVVTARTDEPLDGSLGCPEAGLPADACFGLQSDLALRIAMTETDAGPLLIWLRVASDADMAEEATRFDELLAGVRFADRQPEPAETAAATPYDGEYTWTLTEEDRTAHDPNYTPGSDASYPWIVTMVLEDGAALQTVEFPNDPMETYRGTYEVEGKKITFHLPGLTASYTLMQDADGTVHATAVPPVEDPGGAFVMTAKPWTKTS